MKRQETKIEYTKLFGVFLTLQLPIKFLKFLTSKKNSINYKKKIKKILLYGNFIALDNPRLFAIKLLLISSLCQIFQILILGYKNYENATIKCMFRKIINKLRLPLVELWDRSNSKLT
ncbi:hypothetical protein BpHYR1_031868 [Brachionus plicatilis]|uniref:Uncharacterized protein n=1 Tax=Brachionus plicatilis TaxID=10195 RepID=A0A3M7QME3_BRAPC|nr:hypothetical protein BpHYR1_031868 [Brachionus plicatilis]